MCASFLTSRVKLKKIVSLGETKAQPNFEKRAIDTNKEIKTLHASEGSGGRGGAAGLRFF